MIYGYIRVSTDRQTVENQRFEIQSKYTIDQWFEETISSRVSLENRHLNNLLNQLKDNDTIIVSELSRLGRSIIEIASIMKLCNDKNIIIIAIKENFHLDGSLQAKIMGTILSLLAEVERDLLSQRIKEALKLRKNQGIKLGRPSGKYSKLDIVSIRKMAETMTITDIAKHFNVTRKSIYYMLNNY